MYEYIKITTELCINKIDRQISLVRANSGTLYVLYSSSEAKCQKLNDFVVNFGASILL